MTRDVPAGDAGRRRAVLRMLRNARGPLSIVAIADELNVHPNTVRFHLDSLVADGQAEKVRPVRRGAGRPPLLFRAVRQMDRGGTRQYRILAEVLMNDFAAERDPSERATTAGRAWGERLPVPEIANRDESIDRLIDVLEELGFAPERRESGGEQQVGLRHCPFLELAEARPSVVCPIHLGLMQGALARWAAPVTVDRLEPFVEPDLCLARLVAAQ